jgi:sialate O-acetylesterase
MPQLQHHRVLLNAGIRAHCLIPARLFATGFAPICFFVCGLLSASPAFSDIRLPSLFTDNMVLQQRTQVAIWGWADPGEKIEIKGDWDRRPATTTTHADGTWQTKLTTIAAGGPYTLTIKGKHTIQIHNVLLGEVWLCSGQSNMTFPLGMQGSWRTGVFDYEQEIAAANYPTIRMFTVAQTVADSPRQDVKGDWQICSPSTAGKFSAVAYYFAREITTRTGLPVGLIHSSWGGTPAESWVKKEVLASDADLQPLLDQYTKALAEYAADKGVTTPPTEATGATKTDLSRTAAKKPVNPVTDPKSPDRLYNGMIHPLVPYTLKGVIWYQGESNSDRAAQYQKLFPALIHSWRDEWQRELPFYFVQIAPQYSKVPEIREAQLLTFRSVKRTGMVVITDVGDSLNIHPRNKEVPGKRLALWPLANEYGQKAVVPSGPIYRSMEIQGDKIRISFDYAADGLIAKDPAGNITSASRQPPATDNSPAQELTEWMIAGEDRHFVPAHALIDGNTLLVWSPEVKKPLAVRFAWKNFPRPNLFNRVGLPASPFRTDKW